MLSGEHFKNHYFCSRHNLSPQFRHGKLIVIGNTDNFCWFIGKKKNLSEIQAIFVDFSCFFNKKVAQVMSLTFWFFQDTYLSKIWASSPPPPPPPPSQPGSFGQERLMGDTLSNNTFPQRGIAIGCLWPGA